MKTNTAKVIIKVDPPEQQEGTKSIRKTFQVLQDSADKENLIGRFAPAKSSKLAGEDNPDFKRIKVAHKAVQTNEPTITVEDLTSSDEPSGEYWRLLAETREKALNDSLHENEMLKEHVEMLENENRICKDMLEESKCLVETLQEMLKDDTEDS